LDKTKKRDFGSISSVNKSISKNSISHINKLPIGEQIRNLPSAMKSRPKIPRTPINENLMNKIRKENDSLIN